MTEIIYAIKVASLNYSGLRIIDVKIGKTTNITATLAQYKRSSRNIEILSLWKSNEKLPLSTCEQGIHKLAEQYAYEREGEKFIFLQKSYEDFALNVGLLLQEIEEKKLNDSKKITNTTIKGKGIKIRDQFFQCKYARDVLINTANWLIKQNKLSKDKLPISSSNVRHLINSEPVHQGGNKFVAPEKLVNGAYIETHKSKSQCISSAQKLLDRFGYNRNDLEIINI